MEPPEDSFDPLSTHSDTNFRTRFEDFYIRDMVEYNLRKTAYMATPHCIKECNLFGEEGFNKICFENCLGKHTDSFDVGMRIFAQRSYNGDGSGSESGDRGDIGGQKFMQPIYEKPKKSAKRENRNQYECKKNPA